MRCCCGQRVRALGEKLVSCVCFPLGCWGLSYPSWDVLPQPRLPQLLSVPLGWPGSLCHAGGTRQTCFCCQCCSRQPLASAPMLSLAGWGLLYWTSSTEHRVLCCQSSRQASCRLKSKDVLAVVCLHLG